MSSNEGVVNAFIAEWSLPHPDAARLVSAYFTEDAVYQNMPSDPVHQGSDAITKVLAGMSERLESRGWQVLHQVGDGNIVMNERIDRFRSGDRMIDLPVMGIFELREGRIAAWRDYWDMATWQRMLSA